MQLAINRIIICRVVTLYLHRPMTLYPQKLLEAICCGSVTIPIILMELMYVNFAKTASGQAAAIPIEHIAKTAMVDFTGGGILKFTPVGQNDNSIFLADYFVDGYSPSQNKLDTG